MNSDTIKETLSFNNNKEFLNSDKKEKFRIKRNKGIEKIEEKNSKPKRYVFFLDKPLEKILVR